jgi:hypothetical protein
MTSLLVKFRIFVEFLECLKGLGPSHNYFLKLRVLSAKSPTHRDSG